MTQYLTPCSESMHGYTKLTLQKRSSQHQYVCTVETMFCVRVFNEIPPLNLAGAPAFKVVNRKEWLPVDLSVIAGAAGAMFRCLNPPYLMRTQLLPESPDRTSVSNGLLEHELHCSAQHSVQAWSCIVHTLTERLCFGMQQRLRFAQMVQYLQRASRGHWAVQGLTGPVDRAPAAVQQLSL